MSVSFGIILGSLLLILGLANGVMMLKTNALLLMIHREKEQTERMLDAMSMQEVARNVNNILEEICPE